MSSGRLFSQINPAAMIDCACYSTDQIPCHYLVTHPLFASAKWGGVWQRWWAGGRLWANRNPMCFMGGLRPQSCVVDSYASTFKSILILNTVHLVKHSQSHPWFVLLEAWSPEVPDDKSNIRTTVRPWKWFGFSGNGLRKFKHIRVCIQAEVP